jgi:hypothetical protein
MTAKTRADIQTEIDSLLADNTTGDISPLDVRTVHETSKDSNLNLLDTSGTQTVAGTVNFTGTLQKSGVDVEIVATKRVLVLAKADFPAPSAGVITLAAGTVYELGDDVSLGTDRIVYADNTVIRGIGSVSVTLTYTGTGDMFTFTDVNGRVDNMTVACASGRMINFTCTSQKILRCTDLSVTCDRLGLIDGTNAISRFTNVSPSVMTTSGITFTGAQRSFLYDTSASSVSAGSLFDLGVATFDSWIARSVLASVSGGATFLTGAASSANINTGGVGAVQDNRTSGAGTILSGITVDDARWEFRGNDDIADTRPDGLLSMQGNATATTIAVAGTPVLIAGTWVVERTSQMTGTTGGRLTYDGGKDATLPCIGSFTVEPVSGGAVNISVQTAINGSVVANSKRTASTSAGNPVSITVPWQKVLSTTDFVEHFVTNEDSTVDILVSSAVARVN